MTSTINLTNNLRLPSLEIFLKYYIKYSLEAKENVGEKDDKKDPLSSAMSEKGGLV